MQQSVVNTPKASPRLTTITGSHPTPSLEPMTQISIGSETFYRIPRHPLNAASNEYIYQEKLKVDLILNFLSAGKPIVLLGEPGSGKTEMGRALSHYVTPGIDHLYQMEFSNIISGDMVDGIWQLLNGNTSHLPSEHLKAVRAASEGKRVFYILDEMNRAAPGGLNSLLRLYAQWEYISSTNEVFEIDPSNLMSLATLNVGHTFSGTNAMDAALMDRFSAIELESPNGNIIKRVLQERYPDLSEADITSLVKIYEGSRNVKRGYAVSMRDVQTLAASVTVGGLSLLNSIQILMGGAVRLRGLPREHAESLITLAKSVIRN